MRQRFHQNNQKLYYALATYAWWGLQGKMVTKNNLKQDGFPTLKEIQRYNDNNRGIEHDSAMYWDNFRHYYQVNYMESLGNNDNDRQKYWRGYKEDSADRYRPYKLIVWQGREILTKQEYRVIPLHDIYFLAKGHDYNSDKKRQIVGENLIIQGKSIIIGKQDLGEIKKRIRYGIDVSSEKL